MVCIEQLPLSNEYTAILIIIDRLSKEVVFIPTIDFSTVIDVSEAFVTHVFSKHGTYLQTEGRFHLSFLPISRLSPSNAASLHVRTPPSGQRSGKACQQHVKTISPHLLQLPARPLIKAVAVGWVAYYNTPRAITGVSPFFSTRGYDPLIAVFPEAEVTDPRAKHVTINFDEIQKFLRERMKDAQAL